MLLALFASTAFAAQDISIHTEDGLSLHARVEKVSHAEKGVVLVHMLGRNAGDWDFFAQKLARNGVEAIAPDLRGHGQNARHDLAEADYPAMLDDVKAAVAWLRAQGVRQVSCTGASLGANLCLRAAADDPEIVNVVMLSPGLNIKGITSGDALASYGDRPLLLVASKDDSYAARTAEVLEDKALGQRHLELLDDAGRGTRMLNRDPSLEGLVLSWLLGTYQLASGSVVLPHPALSNDPGSVETTGKKLDAHK